jgi:hypothetical protein
MDLWASGFGLGDQGSSPAAPTAAANDGSGLAQAQAVSVTNAVFRQFAAIGGVPRLLVPDNAKVAVINEKCRRE